MPKKSSAIQLLIILFTTLGSYAQNETKKWLFGNGAGLNFSGSTPSVITGGAITSSLGCASVADAAGNLLFYTDGSTVYNQTHTVMANGTGLFGGNVAQTSIIIKKPASTHEYYVFTQQSTGLYYSVVDMNLASGNGSVTVKNATLFTGNCAGKLTATKHCNGTDYWILAVCSNSFYAYSVSSSSVNTTPVISTILPSGYCPLAVIPSHTAMIITYSVGCMKLSPNGKRLFLVASSYVNTPFMYYNYKESVQLYHFDNNSGGLSNGYLISSESSSSSLYVPFIGPFAPYGAEFSPDGSKVYFSRYSGAINQYDLCNSNCSSALSSVPLSSVTSATDNTVKRSFQLGPDGNIYVAASATSTLQSISIPFIPTNSLGVISNPNAQTGNASYNPTGQSLGTYSCQWGLPNFPGNYFEQRPVPNFSNTSNSASGCSTHSFFPAQLCSASGYSIIGYQWDFGDPLSGAANSSFLNNPIHTFSSAGTYSVRLVRSFSCYTDTIIKVINTLHLGLSVVSNSLPCSPSTASALVSGASGPLAYNWSVGSQTGSVASFSVSGVYSLSVVQINQGCATQATFNIIAPSVQLQLSVTSTSLLCHGLTNASASLNLSGGSGIYSYSWSAIPANNSASINNLAAGVHSVSVNDVANQCTVTRTFIVVQPTAINLSLAPQSPSTCVGSVMQLYGTPSGGIGPYQYNWVGGPVTSNYNISPSVPGNYNYTLNVTDANNCLITGTIGTLFRPLPSIHASNINICLGSAGVFSISGTNSYTWQPANVIGSTHTVSPIVSSIYTVTADSLGCFKTMTLSATVNPAATVSISGNNTLCQGQTLVLNGSPGSASYQWSGPAGFSSASQSASLAMIGPNNAGLYTLTATNSYSCSAKSVVMVLVLPATVINLGSNSPICAGQNLFLNAFGTIANNYYWSGPAGFISLSQNPTIPTSSPAQSGTYTLTVVDFNSCQTTSVVNVVVNPNPNISITGNTVICIGGAIALTAQGASTYSWNTGSVSSVLSLTPVVSTNYIVTGQLATTFCSATQSVSVIVENCTGLYELNENQSEVSVSPNPSSGQFKIEAKSDVTVEVYDQLGKLVVTQQLKPGNHLIELNSKAKGLYYLNWHSGNRHGTIKLMVEP